MIIDKDTDVAEFCRARRLEIEIMIREARKEAKAWTLSPHPLPKGRAAPLDPP